MISYNFGEKEKGQKELLNINFKTKVIFMFFFIYIIPYHCEKIYVTLTSWKGRINCLFSLISHSSIFLKLIYFYNITFLYFKLKFH